MDSAIWALEQGIHARGGANNNAAMAAKDGRNEGMVKTSRDPNHTDSGEGISRGSSRVLVALAFLRSRRRVRPPPKREG